MSNLETYTFIFLILSSVEIFAFKKQQEKPADVCTFAAFNSIQCFCVYDGREAEVVRSADCHLNTEGINEYDNQWDLFSKLKHVSKLVLNNAKGVNLKYIPTKGIKHLTSLLRLDVKHGNIPEIKAYAFGSLSHIQEIYLSDNNIQELKEHSFSQHGRLLSINFDKNQINEIKRNVFESLPSLEKLFFTSNKITTIHDRAFKDLENLKELELDYNSIFSLNVETFYGLRNLQRLELSHNLVEVIGDYTFEPLENLVYLNLQGNRIQMLAQSAFAGLIKLQHLSLASNKLKEIENEKVFEPLGALRSFSINGNKLQDLRASVISPILHNFYEAQSKFNFEDNEFPCKCSLDWFLSLKNETKNDILKLSIENLKCNPDPTLSEAWKKLEEKDKTSGAIFEESPQSQSNEYEYYDESQLEGLLFYIDVRELLKCPNLQDNGTKTTYVNLQMQTTTLEPSRNFSTQVTEIITTGTTNSTELKVKSVKKVTDVKDIYVHTTPQVVTLTQYKTTKVTNHGTLDLSLDESSPTELPDQEKRDKSESTPMNTSAQEKRNEFKSTRTNSPHQENRNEVETTPMDASNHKFRHAVSMEMKNTTSKKKENTEKYEDKEMSSDEAVPNNIEAHRSLQDDTTISIDYNANSAFKIRHNFILLVIMISRILQLN